MTPSMTTPNVTIGSCKIMPEVMNLIPYETMQRYRIAPLEIKDGKLLIATAIELDAFSMDHLRVLSGCELETISVGKDSMAQFLEQNAPIQNSHPSSKELSKVALKYKGDNPTAGDLNAVKSVEKLLALALGQRASDIHLEPQKDGLFVRFRIDGTLKTIHEFPGYMQPSILSRIKILANLDISEKRLPQDGQINFQNKDKDIDLRISTLPAKYGEKVVIRILEKTNSTVGLENLGFEPDMQSHFESLINRPQGLFLVTGPTGSGKTTTLYSVIQRLRSPMKNIVTLEDPIEYELLANSSDTTGITQVQVNPKIGLTFAAALRSTLRQDPDVIMVGEIRDKETAEIAMKSAMTGHLVMSTLHTNDAPSTLERLKDMGVEPYMIASTVIGVLAQRLVRLLCPHCKQGYHPPARSLNNLFSDGKDIGNVTLYRASGCSQCQGFGYRMRKGIFEFLQMSEELKHSINNGADSEEFKKIALSQGLKTLRMGGLDLVLSGLTTIEEVFRVTVD